MADVKTITATALLTMAVVTMAIFTPQFFEEPKYYCEEKPELGLLSCDSFSKYVAENGKCIRNNDTNKICKSGWSLVVDDIVIYKIQENKNTWGKSYKIKEGAEPVLIEK